MTDGSWAFSEDAHTSAATPPVTRIPRPPTPLPRPVADAHKLRTQIVEYQDEIVELRRTIAALRRELAARPYRDRPRTAWWEVAAATLANFWSRWPYVATAAAMVAAIMAARWLGGL